MELSLCSVEPLLSRPLAYNCRWRPGISRTISCRATRLVGEKESANFYEMLSLSVGYVGVDEIKRAYRAMALQYHPDVCHSSMKEKSTRIFVQLHAAYKTLSDPVARREYDFQLGLGNFGRTSKMDIVGDQARRNRWREQIVELKRRSNCQMSQQGSWGSRLRAQNSQRKK